MIGDVVMRRDAATGWSGQVTEVPVEYLGSVRQLPIPITIGGSNNVTFTLNASITRPCFLWNGRNYTKLDRTVVYTWDAVSNDILTSAGVQSTDTDSVLGIWYMYLDAEMDAIWASQTAPSYVEGPSQAGILGHPGTSRNQFYRYIGFMECTTAATPAFRTAVKVGYWYKFAPISVVIITDSWASPTSLALRLPQLAAHGMEVQLTMETGAGGQIFIGSYSASTIWDAELDISEATASNVAEQVLQAPVRIAPSATSKIYAIAAPAGDIHLLGIMDVV